MNISPNHRMFLSIFCNIWKSFLSFFALDSFTRVTNDLDSTDNSNSVSSFPMTNCWGHAPLWESTSGLTDPSRGFTSFTTDCAVPSWWVSSWEKPSWDSRVALQEVSSGRPGRSYISVSVFHSWEDHGMVIIPLWVTCWGETFHKLLIRAIRKLSFGRCRYWVSPIAPLSQQLYSRDLYFHNFSSPSLLKSRMIRSTAPLQSGSSLVAIFAMTRSSCESCWDRFRHRFRTTNCRTEMADVQQTQKMIPFVTCEISLGQYVCELVFGVDALDLDFLGPSWPDRTTNQAQFCGSWKHVSLWDAFL